MLRSRRIVRCRAFVFLGLATLTTGLESLTPGPLRSLMLRFVIFLVAAWCVRRLRVRVVRVVVARL